MMAFSVDEFNERIQNLSKALGDSEEYMNTLSEIQKDREELASRPVYDESEVKDSDGTPWKNKYEEMRTRYRERFFTSSEEIKEDQYADIKKDDRSTTTTFSDLFKYRESDVK